MDVNIPYTTIFSARVAPLFCRKATFYVALQRPPAASERCAPPAETIRFCLHPTLNGRRAARGRGRS